MSSISTCRKSRALPAIIVVATVISACGSGGGSDSASTATGQSTSSPTQSPTPSRAQAPQTSNSLATDANRAACRGVARAVDAKDSILVGVGKGSIPPAQGAQAAVELSGELVPFINQSTGELTAKLLDLRMAYVDIAFGLGPDQSVGALAAGVEARPRLVGEIVVLCRRAGA